MSPSVMTLPAKNFKFLTEDHEKEREIIDFAKKNGLPSETGIRNIFPRWAHVDSGLPTSRHQPI
jgi:hypothetical protein